MNPCHEHQPTGATWYYRGGGIVWTCCDRCFAPVEPTPLDDFPRAAQVEASWRMLRQHGQIFSHTPPKNERPL